MNKINSDKYQKDVEIYTPKYISDSGNKIRFKIPLYQRLFTWKEKHIKDMLDDLQEHFRVSSEPYYLGIITQIYESQEYHRRESDRWLVVLDGQQRLTVLMLLAAFFWHEDKSEEWRKFLLLPEGPKGRPTGPLNGRRPVQDEHWPLRLLPFARPDDKTCLLRLIAAPDGLEKDEKNHLLAKGYAVIRDFFTPSANVADSAAAKAARKELSEKIFNNLTLLVTNLSPTYLKNTAYLNRYFEIMNSNYKNLQKHEVLKVRLLPTSSKEGNIKEIKAKLLSIWKICENFSENVLEILVARLPGKKKEAKQKITYTSSSSLIEYINKIYDLCQMILIPEADTTAETKPGPEPNKDESSQDGQSVTLEDITAQPIDSRRVAPPGGRSIINFPQFLLLALDIFRERQSARSMEEKLSEFYDHDKLLDTFKNNAEACKLQENAEEFYTFLLQIRILLDFYVIRREEGNEDSYAILLEELKGSDKSEEVLWGPKELPCRLAQYQAMLDAAFPEYFYIWLKPYLMHLYELHFGNAGNMDGSLTGPDTTADILLEWLKDWDDKRALEGQCAEDALKPEKLRYNAHVDRYWFWRLDYYLWEGCEDTTLDLMGKSHIRAARAYRMRTNRSIEHLYPQHPQPPLEPWDDPDLHAFGNLAMISSSFNSQQGNEDVNVKFARVRKQIDWSALQSLKLLAMYQAAGEKGENWTQTLARAHEKRMREILLDSFQRKPQGKVGCAETDTPGSEEESQGT